MTQKNKLSFRARPALMATTLLALLLGSTQALAGWRLHVPYAIAQYGYTVQTDVVYGQGEVDFTGGGGTFIDLELDLYTPTITPPANGDSIRYPLMIMLHGGGFQTGSKEGSDVVPSAEAYAERGWMVATINYRLEGDDPIPSSRVAALYTHLGGAGATLRDRTRVAAIDDAMTAMEFLHARADTRNSWTTLWGSSAGANTVLGLTYALDDHGIARRPVGAVVDIAGRFEGAAIGNPFDSPGVDDPDLLTIIGTLDPLLPFSLNTYNWANGVGQPIDYQEITGAGHTPDLFNDTASSGVVVFQHSVDWHLGTMFQNLNQGMQPPSGC